MTKPDRIIKYFEGEEAMVKTAAATHPDNISTGIVLDVETTGLDADTCEVIEIGLVEFTYDSSNGNVIMINKQYDFLNQPSEPLPEIIVDITGLTDEFLAGHTFDIDEVNKIIGKADIIIAHNAKFDRRFTHSLFTATKNKLWACSIGDVNWKEKGFICNHLQHLCNDVGFYYDGHRAEIDCMATLKLLASKDEYTNCTYLLELLLNANAKQIMVEAIGAPFHSKDGLKAAGFMFNVEKKYWYKVVKEDELEETNKILNIAYGGKSRAKIDVVNPLKRFL